MSMNFLMTINKGPTIPPPPIYSNNKSSLSDPTLILVELDKDTQEKSVFSKNEAIVRCCIICTTTSISGIAIVLKFPGTRCILITHEEL